jgi:hypothetical protein
MLGWSIRRRQIMRRVDQSDLRERLQEIPVDNPRFEFPLQIALPSSAPICRSDIAA